MNKQGKGEMKNETKFQPLINQLRLRKEVANCFSLNKVPLLQKKKVAKAIPDSSPIPMHERQV